VSYYNAYHIIDIMCLKRRRAVKVSCYCCCC